MLYPAISYNCNLIIKKYKLQRFITNQVIKIEQKDNQKRVEDRNIRVIRAEKHYVTNLKKMLANPV